MEFIGLLKKDGERTVHGKNGDFTVGQFHMNGLGSRPEGVTFDVLDGEHGRVAEFSKYANKLCNVRMTIDCELYNGRYYNRVVGWSVKPVSEQEAAAGNE